MRNQDKSLLPFEKFMEEKHMRRCIKRVRTAALRAAAGKWGARCVTSFLLLRF